MIIRIYIKKLYFSGLFFHHRQSEVFDDLRVTYSLLDYILTKYFYTKHGKEHNGSK